MVILKEKLKDWHLAKLMRMVTGKEKHSETPKDLRNHLEIGKAMSLD